MFGWGQKLLRALMPTNRPRYVKGTNARDPKTMSPWLKRMRSVNLTATGGWYIDDNAKLKARRRVERYLRNQPGSSVPGHIAEKGMRA